MRDVKTYNRDYYQSHREHLLTLQKKWASSHKEELVAYNADYYKVNKSKLAVKQKEYGLAHKEQRAEYVEKNISKIRAINRKARKKLLSDPTKKERLRLQSVVSNQKRRRSLDTLDILVVQQVYEENIKKYGTLTCELCFKPVEFRQDSLEHFHPISRKEEYPGDINERKNLGVAHSAKSKENCNTKKSKRTLQEWFEQTGIVCPTLV